MSSTANETAYKVLCGIAVVWFLWMAFAAGYSVAINDVKRVGRPASERGYYELPLEFLL